MVIDCFGMKVEFLLFFIRGDIGRIGNSVFSVDQVVFIIVFTSEVSILGSCRIASSFFRNVYVGRIF